MKPLLIALFFFGLFFILLVVKGDLWRPVISFLHFQESTNTSLDSIIRDVDKLVTIIDGESNDYVKVERDLFGESTEGASLNGFYKDNDLKKIAVVHYGETGKAETLYYFADGRLVFVLENIFYYNLPIYMNGSEVERIEPNSYYFTPEPYNRLIRWMRSGQIVTGDGMVEELKKKEQEIKGNVSRYVDLMGNEPSDDVVRP